jgi:hypothetical protein
MLHLQDAMFVSLRMQQLLQQVMIAEGPFSSNIM